MSFDIWVTAFQDKYVTWIPIETVLERFVPHIAEGKDDRYPLRFGAGRGAGSLFLQPREDGYVCGLSVSRPPDDLEFWRIVAGILRDFPCALYWPSTIRTACMGRRDLLSHLPASFIESRGVPEVSTDAAYIRDWVSAHS